MVDAESRSNKSSASLDSLIGDCGCIEVSSITHSGKVKRGCVLIMIGETNKVIDKMRRIKFSLHASLLEINSKRTLIIAITRIIPTAERWHRIEPTKHNRQSRTYLLD